MKKIGGFTLIILGVILVALATLRGISVLITFTNSDTSSYGIGFLVGTATMIILLSALGVKSFKKGKHLVSVTSGKEAPSQ